MEEILRVNNLSRQFTVERGVFRRKAGVINALNGVSFSLERYSTLGLVGESGSGKTTLAKLLLGLIPPSSGEVVFNPGIIADYRKDVQIVFQNPYNSLDTKMRVSSIIAEPLAIHRIVEAGRIKERVGELLGLVGLDSDVAGRYPAELSGGQRQRIAIARALASEPKLLVLDEPISSLDLTVQARMLELFRTLKERFKLTYIFISHNLAVVRHLADTVMVMQNGRIVESAPASEIFSSPQHPYTQALLCAAKG